MEDLFLVRLPFRVHVSGDIENSQDSHEDECLGKGDMEHQQDDSYHDVVTKHDQESHRNLLGERPKEQT